MMLRKSYNLVIAAIAAVIALLVQSHSADAGSWTKVNKEQSHIILNTDQTTIPGHSYETKGWDEAYRFRQHYFGNSGSLGSRFRAGIWYTELAGGRHYRSQQDVQSLPSAYNLFKQRTNAIQPTRRSNAGFTDTDYALFDSSGVKCAIFAATFGADTFHIGTYAGTARYSGFLCQPTGKDLSADTVEAFLAAIGIKDVGGPVAGSFSIASMTSQSAQPASKPTVAAPAAEKKSTPAGNDSAERRLGELKRLFDKGLIDKADYNRKKQEILDTL